MSDPKPDCFHCKHGWNGEVGSIDQPVKCQVHGINLALPIYVFCGLYDDFEGYTDYLANHILPTSVDELQPDQIYMWLHSPLKNPAAHGEKNFQHYLLTTISDYDGWTREQVLEEVGNRAEKLRDEYRKKGYELD